MKIAHVLRRISFADWGGTEQVVWNLAKAQAAAGHEVRIFATNALAESRPPLEKVDGIEIRRFAPVYPWWPMTRRTKAELDRKGGNPFVPGLARALREMSPDVIDCHAMGRIAELCMRTAAALGAKSVVTLHGGSANVPAQEATSLLAPTRGLLPWGKALETALGWRRRVPEDADGIVCVGADEYAHYSRIHPHVLHLPNGVDCARFAAQQPAKSAGIGAGDSLRLLTVARIDRQKNQRVVIEALARHSGMTATFVGPVTQEDYLAELQECAERLGVAARVEFRGPLAPGSAALAAAYHGADAFVLPSRHEPFGIVVLEAWAAGLPVIASDVGGLGRLCRAHPGAALLFNPDAPASLDAAFAELASPERRVALAAAGKEAAALYDWRSLAEKLVAFFTEI